MMVLTGALQEDGYTKTIASALFGRAKSGTKLLLMIVAFTAVASAFLVNDAVVLVVTPLIVSVCRTRELNPVPFLIAAAMSSNIGTVATITGNPQNVLIGLRSGISFGCFLMTLLPVAVSSVVVLVLMTRWRYKWDIIRPLRATVSVPRTQIVPLAVRPSLLVMIGVIVAFILSPTLGLELPLIALGGGTLAMVVSGQPPEKIFRHVNWLLLLFFAALFVVLLSAAHAGLFDLAIRTIHLRSDAAGVGSAHGASMLMSQVVSNGPFTVLVLPLMEARADTLLWLSLASGATLAGNLTLAGSAANLIVADTAARDGVKINFWEFLRHGLPVTMVTMAVSIAVLLAERTLGLIP